MGWFTKNRDSAKNVRQVESWQPARHADRKSYRRRLMVAYVVASLIHSTIFVLASQSPASGTASLDTTDVADSQSQTDAPQEMPSKIATRPLRDQAINISFHAPPAEDGPVDGTAGMDEEALKSLVDQQQARIDEMSIEEQNAELDKRLSQLNNMKQEDVNAALDVVDGIMGTPGDVDHKMKPDPNATGEFDTASMILHDVIRRKSPQGSVVYEYQWVDKAGRTMSQERAAEDMNAGDKQMAGFYEKARGNSLFRSLLDWTKKEEYKRLNQETGR